MNLDPLKLAEEAKGHAEAHRLVEAETLMERAAHEARTAWGLDDMRTIRLHLNLAKVLKDRGRDGRCALMQNHAIVGLMQLNGELPKTADPYRWQWLPLTHKAE